MPQLGSAPKTKLPTLPSMTNVVALQGEHAIARRSTFDPVDGALDATASTCCSPTATSRWPVTAPWSCTTAPTAAREIVRRRPPTSTKEPMLGGDAIHAQVDQQDVGGYMRTLTRRSATSTPNPRRGSCRCTRWAGRPERRQHVLLRALGGLSRQEVHDFRNRARSAVG